MISRTIIKLFTPAISFMKYRQYAEKFIWVGMFFAVPLIITLFIVVSGANRRLVAEQRKIDGIVYLGKTSLLLRDVQLHRGMSSRILSGDTAFIEQRNILSEQITRDLEALNEYQELFVQEGDREVELLRQRGAIASAWGALHRQVSSFQTPQESFIAHTNYISSLVLFMKEVGDAATLFTGEGLTDYYLAEMSVVTLPEMSENVGQSRAYGINIPAGDVLTEEERQQFKLFLTTSKKYLDRLEREVSIISSEQPILEQSLSANVSASNIALTTLFDTYEREFISKDKREISNDAYWVVTTNAIDTILNTYDALLSSYDVVSSAQIDNLKKGRNIIVGFAISALFLVLYFFVGFYLGFKQTVKALAQSTEDILTGKQGGYIALDTRDEFTEITASFNKIISAFTTANAEFVKVNIELERNIAEQKEAEKKLEERAEEIDTFNRLMIGRELKMIELKEEILLLREKLARGD